MPTNTDIIADVIRREVGSSGGMVTNDPTDPGGRTQYGISERANPTAWADGKVTLDEAQSIYEKKYLFGPGFDKIKDPNLRAQLVDYGVNSGPAIAIQKLQGVLGIPVDGILGPQTLAALEWVDTTPIGRDLAKERVRMLCRIVQKNPGQLKSLVGWVNRALEFI